MTFRTAALTALLALPGSVLATAPAPAGGDARGTVLSVSPTPDQVTASKIATSFLARFHYHPVAFDGAFSASVFDHLIKTLDPSRSYFTTQDLASWSDLKGTMASNLKDGDLGPVFAPVNRLLERSSESVVYSKQLLAHGFDFNAREAADVDRTDAAWPTSDDALHDLWRKHTKGDWLRLKLAGQTDKEIRSTLDRRYTAMLRRLQKTTASDAFELVMTACAETADPHTDYFVPQEASQFNSEMSLSLDGIGAYLREHEDYIQITELVPGSPASKSGKIHVGDRIVAIGQGESGPLEDVIGWRSDDVIALIRGKAGTTVRLEMLPDGSATDANLAHVSLVRRKVSMEDQAASSTIIKSVDKGTPRTIGVVTVPSFYEDFDAHRAGDPKYRSLTRDVAGMLADFGKKHVDGVLLDLRNDGGGSLTEASGLAGLFMGAGPVVQVRDAHGEVEVQRSPTASAAWSGPLGVLVNHGSASASEIFAAAIQDRGRGTIMGERTFGKGTVQNLVDLSALTEGPEAALGELKMTIAEFYRINGTSTQLLGVTPDVAFPDQGNEALFGESSYDNALPNSHIAAIPFARSHSAGLLSQDIVHQHDARIARSPRWALMLDELKTFKQSLAVKTESLNFAERKASRDTELATAKKLRARLLAIDASEGVSDSDDASAVEGDDGLVATERKLATKRPDGKVNPATDAQLKEAAQIVADEASSATLLAHGRHI